ncbi:MAG: hypothetical protein NUV83_01950 [Candidatus Wolfebacteria bacterium]|nr:hypothetical protein [Candidatus Wolfebacteria bacterium]
MRKILGKIFKKSAKKEVKTVPLNKAELEKKAIEGAKKAIKDYRRVFERLAEYDRV